jgi:hypothetical protein
MKSTIRILLIAAMAAAFGACGGSGDDDDGDAGDTDTHSSMDAGPDASGDTDSDTDTGSELDTDTFSDLPCPDLDAGFDEATPGYQMFLDIGSVTMMGQKIGTGVGGFQNTGREDFDPVPAPALALDECKLDDSSAQVPECALNGDDCPSDQECVQDTDSNGNPIAGTEHCATPRTMIDVGPFTMYGFADGPKTFTSSAANSGAYMAGDGTIPPASFAYDATYAFYGLGNLAAGVGAFWGDLYLGPDTQLTKPAVSSVSGIPVIKVNPNDDLEIEWSGPVADGELTITLVGAKLSGQSASVTCRVADDGAFTIPSDLVGASGLGALALLNTLMLERRGVGRVCGEGLTSGAVSTVQTYMVNVQKTGGTSTDAGVDGGN